MRAARAGAIVERMGSDDVSAEEFRALFRAVRRWGGDDARGALRHLTPERVVERGGARPRGRQRDPRASRWAPAPPATAPSPPSTA